MGRLDVFTLRHCKLALMLTERAMNDPESMEYREACLRVLAWKRAGLSLDEIAARSGWFKGAKIHRFTLAQVCRMLNKAEGLQ